MSIYQGAYLSGNTLLTLAAEKGHEDVAELLIDRGANLDVKVGTNAHAQYFILHFKDILYEFRICNILYIDLYTLYI